MLGRPRSRTARLAALAAVLALTATSAALAAPGSASHRQRLNVTAQRLDTRVHQALLGLYALDSQLQAWRVRLSSLATASAALQSRRLDLRQELGAAETSLRVAQRQLAVNLRTLYEQGNLDPVAVMLGATSLTAALRELDDMRHVADEGRRIVSATTAARARLLRSRLRLRVEARRLARSLAAAHQAERRLAGAAEARFAFVSSLRARERMRETQLRSVVATARAVQQKSQRLQRPTPPAAGRRQLVVSATCYDLPGKTATGMPVGWGVVAVDPSVIPLGSRMYIPGYGNGVAADVGSGIRGAVIDLWFPTYAQCAAWGRRMVTVTIF